MQPVFYLFGAFIGVLVFSPGSCVQTVTGLYGETIEVPCNNGNNKPEGLIFTKWKYVKDDGSEGDLLVKQAQKDEATVIGTDGYKNRVSIAANSSLMIARGSLTDQRVFTCMVVSLTNLDQYSVEVRVYKKPSDPVIKNKAKKLENGKLTKLGDCVVESSNPEANLTWMKNNLPLVDDGKTIIIIPTVTKDPVTGLSSTSSSLQYTANKDDMRSQFTCSSKHVMGDQVSSPETFPIHYPTEKVSLQVLSQSPIMEGDNITLKCQADGNPPPTSFNFIIKGKKVRVTGKDVYTLTGVTRDDSGTYKCSLADNDAMESTQIVTVSYPTEKVSLQVLSQSPIKEGDNITLKCQADGNPPPTSFNFIIKGKKVRVTGKDVYTLTGVTRDDSGTYKCSLADNDAMESTQIVTVSYDFTKRQFQSLCLRVFL